EAAVGPGAAMRRLDGDDATRHLIRLACGLESAVLGEDQILHQVRLTLAELRDRHADPALVRLFELAVAAGRRARAASATVGRDLGERAVRWLEARTVVGPGSTAPVVGAGAMGRAAASAFGRRGAHVLIASRTVERAAAAAGTLPSASPVSLDGAVRA